MKHAQGWLKARGSKLKTLGKSFQPSAFSLEPRQRPSPRKFTRGQMLVIVLWVLGLVSLAVGALVVQSTHEMRLGRMPLDGLKRKAIVQAGLQQAIQVLEQDTRDAPQVDALQEPWASGREATGLAMFDQVVVGEGQFSIGHLDGDTVEPGLIDEERKLNLHTVSLEHLTQLIELVGPADTDAQALAGAIQDWQDEPDGPFCQQASPPCHNGPLDSVDELRLVPGMTPELFAALAPYVTVYGSGTVNVNTASAVVLNAMGYPGEELVQQRKSRPFESYDGLSVTSRAFTVPIEAQLARSSARLAVRVVIDRVGCAPNAPADSPCVLAWLPQ